MKMSEHTNILINELIYKSLEGEISEDENRILNDFVSKSENVAYYYKSLHLHTALKNRADILTKNRMEGAGYLGLQELAFYEKIAPVVELAENNPLPELTQKVVYPQREKRKLSKFSIFMLLNTAAIILFFLFLRFAPLKSGIEVATLTDSINAKWADVGIPMQDGIRLYNDKTPLMLKEGLVELKFDNNARITIEGPAEFQILDSDMIKLNYGQLYSQVPAEAYGFQICTKHSKIIDLGTEFGIKEGLDSDTEVHVLKGRVNLISNVLSKKINVNLSAGSARKLDAATGELKEIQCEDKLFARQIESKTNTIWRGQKTLDLADIIGGGNGLGTGQIDIGINPVNGTLSSERPGSRESANDYHPVSSSPYIDGIFVPNGRTQQIVSSEGHLFRECPVTSGLCCENILNVVKILDSEDMKISDSPSPCVWLHANMGITFDLQAIRDVFRGVNIVRFQSKFGIRKWAARPNASNADFWVLVDGELRYQKKQVRIGELYSVDIELSETDHFLTLVETDGGDSESRILNGVVLSAIDSDWGMFVNPVLVLE